MSLVSVKKKTWFKEVGALISCNPQFEEEHYLFTINNMENNVVFLAPQIC